MALILVNRTSLNHTQKAELRRIEGRLLAPCCYTQSIAVHGSEVARQMRTEVAEMVAEGRTEEEIVNHYKSLYGDRVLIVPDGVTGKILFSLPVVTSVLASLVLFMCIRKMLHSGKRRLPIAQDHTPSVINKPLREKIQCEIGRGSEFVGYVGWESSSELA
jgi:cytochrome c-type biogenesis protein CcmH